jgi:site-specific DNA recombinase
MKPAPLRCAIYTRVSTEHGLGQEFNSLDNQREAAEAYVKSQAHEGWRCLPDLYDDGGFSGGSMERPAIQRLLAEIRARRIDVVVVYKVDRLTRSLSDFAKLVELFDAHGVSFVSVTQAFNTTTSMGRLTLNVLLSFAQFEREVTGERIRDKIAASKKKGIWMGGVVPLGYRAEARALHIVEDHAATIRTIFARYLELASASTLKRSLDDGGIIMPVRIDGAGRRTGGKPFSRGHLYAILANPIYVGRLVHRKLVHEGQHPAIVDQAIFDAVQAKLAANHHAQRQERLASDHLLLGRIYDQKGALRYRYYVSRTAIDGQPTGSVARVPAPEIEALVIGALRAITPAAHEQSDAALIASRLRQVSVHPDELILELTEDAAHPIRLPWTPKANTRRREIIMPPGTDRQLRPMKVEDRSRILKAIATARCWIDDLATARISSTLAIASREGVSERSVRMTLSLAHLSPTIVRAIMDGRLPRGLGIKQLSELPTSWTEQEHALGF